MSTLDAALDGDRLEVTEVGVAFPATDDHREVEFILSQVVENGAVRVVVADA